MGRGLDQPLRVLTNAQRCKIFGRFEWEPDPKPGNPERIRLLGRWALDNIVPVEVPQLKRKVLIHRLAKDALLELFRDWELRDLLKHVHTFNGSFVPRFKRGRAGGSEKDLSNHSWGTALDINAREYPLGRAIPEDDPMRELARVAAPIGWLWGGHFRSRPDGMHFEYVRSTK